MKPRTAEEQTLPDEAPQRGTRAVKRTATPTPKAKAARATRKKPSVAKRQEDAFPSGFRQCLPKVHGASVRCLSLEALPLQTVHRPTVFRLETPSARINHAPARQTWEVTRALQEGACRPIQIDEAEDLGQTDRCRGSASSGQSSGCRGR